MNKVTLVGRLVANPEFREQADGTLTAMLTVETSTHWLDSHGDKREHLERTRVSVYHPVTVGVVKTDFRKGSELQVEGVLQTRRWVDHQNIERYATEVIVLPGLGSLKLMRTAEPSPSSPDVKNRKQRGVQCRPS